VEVGHICESDIADDIGGIILQFEGDILDDLTQTLERVSEDGRVADSSTGLLVCTNI